MAAARRSVSVPDFCNKSSIAHLKLPMNVISRSTAMESTTSRSSGGGGAEENESRIDYRLFCHIIVVLNDEAVIHTGLGGALQEL